MLNWWQTLPLEIDPVAWHIGFFSLYWYGIFLLLGILLSAFLLRRLHLKGTWPEFSATALEKMAFWALLGGFLGGKIGYVLFYAGGEFLADPHFFVSPYDRETGVWRGLAGMSYHGAFLGSLLALFFWSGYQSRPRASGRARALLFWRATDVIAICAPVLTFFGRLGNFFTGELYGRITEQPWGMLFQGVLPLGSLRHPSALYEALVEGLLLGLLIFVFRNRFREPGTLTLLYITLYAFFRFLCEFFREPDPNRGLLAGFFSMGQLLSAALLIFAYFLWKKRVKYDTVNKR